MDEELRSELIERAERDRQVRDALAAQGQLAGGYHPRMREVHEQNADFLGTVLDARGWPGAGVAGEDGAEAAWRILQHAIGRPGLLRRGLRLLERARDEGQVPGWQPAYLLDRIRFFEGLPQVYGTQFEPGEDGWPEPCPIEDAEHVDERRRSVGLGPLEELKRRMRAEHRPGAKQPDERRGFDEWLRETGWRR